MRHRQRIWMQCGPPPYYLPQVVASSVEELSRRCGVSVNAIRSYISHKKNVRRGYAERYVVVDVEEDEDEPGSQT